MRLGKYIKKAFGVRWNILALMGGTIFAFMTGRPDVVLPILAAGEIAYLGLLATQPRFQEFVDAQDAKKRRVTDAAATRHALQRIKRALPAQSLQRYETLRVRCMELRKIANDLRHTDPRKGELPFERLQLEGLDRLLWIYLRLLYTEFALGRFLEHTSPAAIQKDIERLESRLAHLGEEESEYRQKARNALEDNLETSRARLDNLVKANENFQLVRLEIDRLENKIRKLSEMAVNRQEPDFISDQVDSVAESMIETERTMNELDLATGFDEIDETIPQMLDPNSSHRRQKETSGPRVRRRLYD